MDLLTNSEKEIVITNLEGSGIKTLPSLNDDGKMIDYSLEKFLFWHCTKEELATQSKGYTNYIRELAPNISALGVIVESLGVNMAMGVFVVDRITVQLGNTFDTYGAYLVEGIVVWTSKDGKMSSVIAPITEPHKQDMEDFLVCQVFNKLKAPDWKDAGYCTRAFYAKTDRCSDEWYLSGKLHAIRDAERFTGLKVLDHKE